MNTRKLSYAHLLAEVNPKHVNSLLEYFQSGCKTASANRLGVEIEHLPVDNADNSARGYFGDCGIEVLLKRLRPFYQTSQEYREQGHLLGLGREGISVSLEPGGQVESSIGPLRTPQEVGEVYGAFRHEIDPIAHELGFRLVNYGYQPVSGYADIRVIPKRRYAVMTEYEGRIGQFGLCMMRSSSSTQISIDYQSERDAIDKMRVGTAIGPIISWFFRNTPFFEGAINPYPLLRQRLWDFIDFQRTNLTPGLFDARFSWEDYAIDVLATPLMYVDLTHTPEASSLPIEQQCRIAFKDNANDIYPDRPLNSYEIRHILSMHFNDVRLKNIVEIRHWDSLPEARIQKLAQVVSSLFYDPKRFGQLRDLCGQFSESDVFAAKTDLQAHGPGSQPYGKSLGYWCDYLSLNDTGADQSGDPKYPQVFQA